ncbi:Cytoplasmic dynein 2 intermediate chain 1 [Manis javanica]|nr:Cytoplasmic dynein 2 intermediate chain 1 [Manis javanica]
MWSTGTAAESSFSSLELLFKDSSTWSHGPRAHWSLHRFLRLRGGPGTARAAPAVTARFPREPRNGKVIPRPSGYRGSSHVPSSDPCKMSGCLHNPGLFLWNLGNAALRQDGPLTQCCQSCVNVLRALRRELMRKTKDDTWKADNLRRHLWARLAGLAHSWGSVPGCDCEGLSPAQNTPSGGPTEEKHREWKLSKESGADSPGCREHKPQERMAGQEGHGAREQARGERHRDKQRERRKDTCEWSREKLGEKSREQDAEKPQSRGKDRDRGKEPRAQRAELRQMASPHSLRGPQLLERVEHRVRSGN